MRRITTIVIAALALIFALSSGCVSREVPSNPEIVYVPMYSNSTVPVFHNNTVISDEGSHTIVYSQEPPPHQPETIYVSEPAKYPRDFMVFSVCISQLPTQCKEWSGNGVPFFNIYFLNVHDDGMMIQAAIFPLDYVGWDACRGGFLFGNWTVENKDGWTAYSAAPSSHNPYDFLGSGNVCLTRLHIESDWMWGFQLEGDGNLSAAREEIQPNGDMHVMFDNFDLSAAGLHSWALTP